MAVVPNTFTINIDSVLRPNSDGSAQADIPHVQIPSGIMEGVPKLLAELIDMVGKDNINLEYYLKPRGVATGHSCWGKRYLNVIPTYDHDHEMPVVTIAETTNIPDTPTDFDSYDWILLSKTNLLMTKITSGGSDDGSGNYCSFASRGGWKSVTIDMQIKVVINLSDFCKGCEGSHKDICTKNIDKAIIINKIESTQSQPQSIKQRLQNHRGGVQHFTQKNQGGNKCTYLIAFLIVAFIVLSVWFIYSKKDRKNK